MLTLRMEYYWRIWRMKSKPVVGLPMVTYYQIRNLIKTKRRQMLTPREFMQGLGDGDGPLDIPKDKAMVMNHVINHRMMAGTVEAIHLTPIERKRDALYESFENFQKYHALFFESSMTEFLAAMRNDRSITEWRYDAVLDKEKVWGGWEAINHHLVQCGLTPIDIHDLVRLPRSNNVNF